MTRTTEGSRYLTKRTTMKDFHSGKQISRENKKRRIKEERGENSVGKGKINNWLEIIQIRISLVLSVRNTVVFRGDILWEWNGPK